MWHGASLDTCPPVPVAAAGAFPVAGAGGAAGGAGVGRGAAVPGASGAARRRAPPGAGGRPLQQRRPDTADGRQGRGGEHGEPLHGRHLQLRHQVGEIGT